MNKNKLTAALKKKALGAAIAVAISTPALADVTMFGIVDVGVGNEGGAINANSINAIKSNSIPAIIFK